MDRMYRCKVLCRTYKNYTDEDIDKALTKIVDVHIGPLTKHLRNSRFCSELYFINTTGFTKQEAYAIIQSVVTCSDWGFSLCIEDLQMVTKSFLDRQRRLLLY